MSGWNSGFYPHIQSLGNSASLGISSQRTQSILELLLLRHLPGAAAPVLITPSEGDPNCHQVTETMSNLASVS